MSDVAKIKQFLVDSIIDFDLGVDLKTKTWIKRGGIAGIWVQPIDLYQFETLICWCQLNKIMFEVIGNTSNCYFLNDYHPDLVISTLKLTEMHINEDTITCDCGYNMTRLAKYCISNGVVGYEGFIGLPGTVGGAAINNAGCYGSLISEVVESVILMINGEVQLFSKDLLNYSHRNSDLKSKKNNGIIISATFNIKRKEDPSILKKLAENYQFQRKTYQEHKYPNLGTTFNALKFKRLPLFSSLLNEFAGKILNGIIGDGVKKQILTTKLFLRIRNAGKFKAYVSDYNIGCFTWKDCKADLAFEDYLNFIEKVTTEAIIEIDIKGKNI